jgi:hypothetical protein
MRELADSARIEQFMRELELIPDCDEILREEERSPLIRREGKLAFHHFDPVAQALSKIERGHEQDIQIDPVSFRKAVEESLST